MAKLTHKERVLNLKEENRELELMVYVLEKQNHELRDKLKPKTVYDYPIIEEKIVVRLVF